MLVVPLAFAWTGPVTATIATMSELDVTVSRIIGDTWTPDLSSLDFGTLEWDDTDSIFRSQGGRYYAVDAGVVDNTGSWTITHTSSSITNGTDNLDNNINVVFIDEFGNAGDADILDKLSYADANGQSYTKADFTSGRWLRIYYGLATGENDATGVEVIGVEKSTGTYTGSITLTLTP
ncbi:MAG: hypothetical protein NG712_02330 [Omnitrophica bacterium]|nr:hypothetical protein [Candidatus Omnitrophota bacterium]